MIHTEHHEPEETPGARLARLIREDHTLSPHEEALLDEAAATLDTLADLEAAVRRDGAVLEGGKIHPAAAEARQQRIVLARLLASLRVPEEAEDGAEVRPQRRGGARGTYRPRLVGS